MLEDASAPLEIIIPVVVVLVLLLLLLAAAAFIVRRRRQRANNADDNNNSNASELSTPSSAPESIYAAVRPMETTSRTAEYAGAPMPANYGAFPPNMVPSNYDNVDTPLN
jgi:flagellar biosynthesis/type III secretory pathway M-ring protein FliF/YscJ